MSLRIVKIILTYDEDPRDYTTIVCRQRSDHYLDEDFECYGFLTDWSEDHKHYMRYPFTLEHLDGQEAIVDYGAWDLVTQTTLSIFNRKIVEGEKITRKEANEQYQYTVTSITVLS